MELKGLAILDANLAKAAAAAPRLYGAALYQEGEAIMAASKEIVPLRDGPLRASGHVDLPVRDGDAISVTLGYGGPAVPYAVKQHEDISLAHANGREAKYLERPLFEAGPQLPQRLAQRVGLDDLAS